MEDVLTLILITFAPFLELRASIPYGIGVLNMQWSTVFLVTILANIALGIIIYFLLSRFVNYFLKFNLLNKFYNKIVERNQRKINKYVNKYGLLGIALFIGVPLPGSGSYTGALVSYFIGLGFRRFIIANIIGVLIAGIIVTLVSTGLLSLF